MWFFRKHPLARRQLANPVRRASRAVVETMEQRCFMSITSFSLNQGDYVAPQQNGSNPPTGGSLVERISGINASFTFDTDHDGVDGGQAQAIIRWGDEGPGPIAPETVYTGNNNSLSHTYAEAGDYTLSVTVYDTDTPPQGSTTSGWQGSTVSGTMSLHVNDAPFGNLGGGISAYPNATYSGTVGYIGDPLDTASNGTIDYGYVNLNDYSGTIDWGDGTTTAASFGIADGGKIAVIGTHTYSYVTDPDTGIAFPLESYGEQAQYPISVHVADTDGGAADFSWMAAVNLPPHFMINSFPNTDPTKGQNKINLSVAAGVGTIWVTKLDAKQKESVISPPVSCAFKPGTSTVTITTTPGNVNGTTNTTDSITLTYTATAADVGTTCKLIVSDASGVRGVVTLVFVP